MNTRVLLVALGLPLGAAAHSAAAQQPENVRRFPTTELTEGQPPGPTVVDLQSFVPQPSVEDSFLQQPRDEPWASRTEQRIFEALTQLTTGAESIDAECRLHECRVQIVSDVCRPRGPNAGKEEFDAWVNEMNEIETLISEATGYRAMPTCFGWPPTHTVVHVLRSNSAEEEPPPEPR